MRSKTLRRFWIRVDKEGSYPDPKKYPKIRTRCWIWIGGIFLTTGYGRFWYHNKSVLAHRMAWKIYNGEDAGDAHILHKCDNRLCVRHLFKGNYTLNMQDMVNKGRSTRGSRHNKAKLTEKQVLRIRKMYATGKFSCRDLASRFPVDFTNIANIVNRTRWTHI